MRFHLKPLLTCAVIAAFSGLTSAVHADLIGYWPFEDDPSGKEVADVSGNGFDSLGSDSFGFSADGFRGAAGDFGDFNNGAIVLLAEEFATGDNGFNKIVESQEVTISFWLNRQGDAATNAWTFLFGGSRQLGSHAPWGDGVVYFDVAGCCGANQRISTSMGGTDGDGEWHHLAYVKRKDQGEDLSVTAVYLDGAVLVSSPGWDGVDAPTIDDVVPIDAASIGGDNGGGASHNGLMDEFAIWDEALPEDRIIALSAGGPVLPPVGVPGDFNGDGSVTTADFSIMAANFGQRFSFDEALSKGDYNGDLRVNLKDFLAFRQAWNAPAGAAASVPEPSSIVLIGWTACGLFGLRRRRH